MKILKIPMLHDSHNHVAFNIALSNCLNVRDMTYEEVIAELSLMNNNKINIITGWMFYDFERADLEKLPPVFICDNFLHAFFLNSKSKKMLRNQYPDMIENIENTEWVEKNLPAILNSISEINDITIENINRYFEDIERKGVYSVEDMLVPNGKFIDLVEQTKYKGRCKFWMDICTYKKYKEKYKNKVEGLKIFLDGALTPETASISGYFSGSEGLLIHIDSELLELLRFVESEEKRAAIHSVGDKGVEQLLRVVETNGINIHGLRLEHAMFISEEQAERVKALGIILSMQTNFSFDSVIFSKSIQEKVLRKINPFRMLIDKVGFVPGKNLFFNSDGMPTGVEFAVKSGLFPPYESQKLTLEELIAGYSINGAKDITLEIIDNEPKIIEQ